MSTIEGYVSDVKNFGRLCFLYVRTQSDRNGFGVTYQYVTKDPVLTRKCSSIPRESYVCVNGVAEPSQKSKHPSYVLEDVEVVAANETKVYDTVDDSKFNRSFDAVEYRKLKYHNVVLTRAALYNSVRTVCDSRRLIEITTPKLTGQSSEGGSEIFQVISDSTNHEKLWLAQSPQLYKQVSINMGLKGVYQIGSIFRAEKFKTSRHLNEATCWDVELSCKSLDELFEVIIDAICTFTRTIQSYGLGYEPMLIRPQDFGTVTYTDVCKMLRLKDGIELSNQHEREVTKMLNKRLVFIINYPPHQRPFYNKDVQNFDLVCGTGELSSGGLRETNFDRLVKQIKSKLIDVQSLSWYVHSFKQGAPQTGGFGFGLDRFLCWYIGVSHIKDVKTFPWK